MLPAEKPAWLPLGALLVREGLITNEQLETALTDQQGTGLRLGPKQPIEPRDLALPFVTTRTLVRLIARRALARIGRTRKLAGLGED